MINTNYVSVKWGARHGKAPQHFVLSTKPNSEFQQCPGLILTGFQVSLSKLDWGSTIIAPISYQANYCAGTCTFPLSKVSNYIILSMLVIMPPCALLTSLIQLFCFGIGKDYNCFHVSLCCYCCWFLLLVVFKHFSHIYVHICKILLGINVPVALV